jgi:hypothetical protein
MLVVMQLVKREEKKNYHHPPATVNYRRISFIRNMEW